MSACRALSLCVATRLIKRVARSGVDALAPGSRLITLASAAVLQAVQKAARQWTAARSEGSPLVAVAMAEMVGIRGSSSVHSFVAAALWFAPGSVGGISSARRRFAPAGAAWSAWEGLICTGSEVIKKNPRSMHVSGNECLRRG